MLGRLYRASVWAPEAIPANELDEQFKRRLFLPAFDVVMIVVGFIIVRHPVPSLDEKWSPWFITAVAAVFVLGGSLALIGVAFPRLELLELAAKAALIGVMVVYPAALMERAFAGSDQTWLGSVCLFALVGIPMERGAALIPKVHRRWKATQDTREIPTAGDERA